VTTEAVSRAKLQEVVTTEAVSRAKLQEVVTTGAVSRAKLQSNHHHQQTNTQFVYRSDAIPVTQPTVSKH